MNYSRAMIVINLVALAGAGVILVGFLWGACWVIS